MKMWVAPLLWAMVGMGTVASAQTAGPMRVTEGIETPTAEAAAAVLFADFRKDRGEQKTAPDFGWSLSVGANLGAWLTMLGEADGYANYYDAPDTRPGYGAHAAVNHVYAFLAGPRVHSGFLHVGKTPYANDLRVFGQLLTGIRVSETLSGGRAIQPGAGVDVHTKYGFTVRNELDYCFVSGSGRGLSGGRWLVGLVFGPS
jgi:hypothetical protein